VWAEGESAWVASRVHARTKRARKGVGLRWAAAGALILVGLLYYRPLHNYVERRAAVAERRAEVAALAAERETLVRRVRYVESAAAVARDARRLGFVRPGERLFIVKGIAAWRAARKARATIARGG
jgi:cell division protein FtsB